MGRCCRWSGGRKNFRGRRYDATVFKCEEIEDKAILFCPVNLKLEHFVGLGEGGGAFEYSVREERIGGPRL